MKQIQRREFLTTVAAVTAGTCVLPRCGIGQSGSSVKSTLNTAPPSKKPFSAFYAFDTAFWGHQGWGADKQAKLLKELGYDGIGMSGLRDLENRVAAFEKQGLKVFNLYVGANLGGKPVVSAELKKTFPLLKEHGIDLWMPLSGPKNMSEEAKVAALQELADAAGEHDVRIVIYPHHGCLAPTASSALPLVKKAERKNLGLTINLCHELKAGNGRALPGIVKQCGPYITLVSINGADLDGNNWGALIQPLDRGDFDVPGLLKELQAVGYEGSIGLQCYGIREAPEQHLKRSISRWQEIAD